MSSAEQPDAQGWDERGPEQGPDAFDKARKNRDYLDDFGTEVGTVGEYLRRIGNIPLLNAEQEVELSKRIEAGVFAETIRDIRNPETRDDTLEVTRKVLRSRPSLAEETVEDVELKVELAIENLTRYADNRRRNTDKQLNALITDGERAKQTMIESNLRLVVNLAKRYTGRGMPFLDLIQEGNLGLNRAVEKFDYTKGYKFSTYATWWIRQAITRGMADQARTIRLPVHIVEQVNKTNRIRRDLAQDLGREPTDDEVAKESGIPLEKIEGLKQYGHDLLSLNQRVGDDADGEELGNFIQEDRGNDQTEAEAAIAQYDMARAIGSALGRLSEREQRVITLRFGLEDGNPRTLDVIGQITGVTRERVRQIEQKAMVKFRQTVTADRLRQHYE